MDYKLGQVGAAQQRTEGGRKKGIEEGSSKHFPSFDVILHF